MLSAHGQLNVSNPDICHDKEGYLKCYNDGTFSIKFSNGYFTEFMPSDSSFGYIDKQKRLWYLDKFSVNKPNPDTIYIELHPKHLRFIKNGKNIEVKSLKNIPAELLTDFHIGTYSVNNILRGFKFGWDKYFTLQIDDYGKELSWDIMIEDGKILAILDYNSFKKNRLDHIFITDDSLRNGMVISTSFRTGKRVWHVEPQYVIDSLWSDGVNTRVDIITNKKYSYCYLKNGRLDKKRSKGEMKLCDCVYQL